MADIVLTSIAERDIDMLLLEEFAANAIFSRWFAGECGVAGLGDPPVLAVSRGVTTSTGESDLEVSLLLEDGSTHYFLIENKVAANFQPRQAERYRERGDRYVGAGECGSHSTVLVAPRSYIGNEGALRGFDHCISYEAIQEWCLAQPDECSRLAVRIAILETAIRKSTRGYVPVEHQPVTRFWRDYWVLCSEIAPELQMPEPGPKPTGAGFILFRPEGLLGDVRLLHKLAHGNADLQFSGMGGSLGTLRERVLPYLDEDMLLTPANKSGVVRLKVPPLDTTAEFESQLLDARSGIEACLRLLRWYSGLGDAHDRVEGRRAG